MKVQNQGYSNVLCSRWMRVVCVVLSLALVFSFCPAFKAFAQTSNQTSQQQNEAQNATVFEESEAETDATDAAVDNTGDSEANSTTDTASDSKVTNSESNSSSDDSSATDTNATDDSTDEVEGITNIETSSVDGQDENVVDVDFKYEEIKDDQGNAIALRITGAKIKEDSKVKKGTLVIPSVIKDSEGNIKSDENGDALIVMSIAEGAFSSLDPSEDKDVNFFDTVEFDVTEGAEVAYDQYLAIEKNAFNNTGTKNQMLKKIVANRDITLGESCFEGNTLLEKATFNADVKYICDHAFKNCAKLKKISWDMALANDYLEEFKLPDEVYTFGSYVFEGCESLESIHIPFGIKYVSDGALGGAANLKTAVFPDTVENIGSAIFGDTPDASQESSWTSVKIQKAIILNEEANFNKDAFFHLVDDQPSASVLTDLCVYSPYGFSRYGKACKS